MSKRLRILFTTSNFKTAGSGKVIYDLVKGLDKTKFDIEIACGHDDGEYFKTIASLGLPIHIFQTKTSYRPYISLFSRIRTISKFIKHRHYDIVHSWQWSNDWTEAVATKMAGSKWIYTKKAMGFESRHWRIKSYLSDFIITINDEMRTYFPNKKNQALIPLGIDADYYNPGLFAPLEASNQYRIIIVANLVPVKGLEVLLHAIHGLNDPTIRLSVLGYHGNAYGTDMQTLSQSLGLQEQVSFLGRIPDVRPYIAESDLYVIPTLDQGRKEGMPMALVEAMSMGIPVLGSNISGINYVLKDFQGLLFKAGDAEALKASIIKMKSLTFEQRSTIGTQLRSYCLKHFTIAQFVQAHELLYSKLITE